MTIDIDAIRESPRSYRVERLVPALCDEIEQLRAELDEAREQAKDSAYAAEQARTAVTQLRAQVVVLADKLHKANAEVGSLTKATTAYANENARLRRQLADIACLKCWTNEDGKRFVFVTDIQTALGVPTEAGVDL